MIDHKGTVSLDTPRLILRKFKEGDYEMVFNNYASDDKVTTFLTWPTHKDYSVSKTLVSSWSKSYGDIRNYNWAIVLKENMEVIGSISVVGIDEELDSMEIGYCLSSKYWNKGIMTEACQKVIEYLFKETNVNKIFAVHHLGNDASGKVLLKSHMTYEGTIKDCVFDRNHKLTTCKQYSIVRREFEEI